MGSSMDRFRIRNKHHVVGAGSDDAALYSGIISELAKTGGAVASGVMKQKEDKKKEEYKAALAKADGVEKDKNGPVHKAIYEQMKKDGISLDSPAIGPLKEEPKAPDEGIFSSRNVLIGLALVGAGLMTYALVSRGGRGSTKSFATGGK